jgi:sec-independent protein translocase protein TatC
VTVAGELPKMPLMEHLRELRRRLIVSVAALLLGMGLALPLCPAVLNGLKAMCTVCHFQVLDPTEGFVTYFRVAMVLGMVLATPVILYQIVAFVRPALYPREQRYLLRLLPGTGLLFAVGLAFGYWVVLPRTVNFLAEFPLQWVGVEPNWRLGGYIAFVTNLLVIVGVAFETPIVVYALSKVGLLSWHTMVKYRRHAIVILAILAAVLTPTPDPFTMLLVLVPMVLLYEMGILLARFA